MWLLYLQRMLLLENIFLAWKDLTFNKSFELTEDNLVLTGLCGLKRERSDSMETQCCVPPKKKSYYF